MLNKTATTKTILGLATLFSVVLSYQNCAKVNFAETTPASISSASVLQAPPPTLVCSFNGELYQEGDKVTAFLASSVAFNQRCQSEERICKSGMLSGSFAFSSCNVDVPKSCLFNGKQVPHGEKRTAYLNSSVAYDKECQSQESLCNNGKMSSDYQFESCQKGVPLDCKFNDIQVKHGESIMAAEKSEVPFGSECNTEIRKCINGGLSGSYKFASCNPGKPASCLFNQQTIAHETDVTAYQTSSVAYNETCKEEKRICHDGKLSGNYEFASCKPEIPAACLINGSTINSGQEIVLWKEASLPVGQDCQRETNLCTNGKLSGTYRAASCVVDQVQTKDIAVNVSTEYKPFRLLLIVDDSTSMTSYQAKLAANIDSLITPLKGRDVSVKVITTSDKVEYMTSVFDASNDQALALGGSTYYPRAGTLAYWGKASNWCDPTGLTPCFYFDNNGSMNVYPDPYPTKTVVAKSTLKETGGRIFTLKADDTQAQINTTLAALKAYMTSLGTSGSAEETSFCPLLRNLRNTDVANRFLSPTDSLAVVIITDEDESKTMASCPEKLTTTFQPTTALPGRAEYRYMYKYMYAHYSYAERKEAVYSSNDGVQQLIIPASDITTGSGSIPYSFYDYKNDIVGKCSEALKAKAFQYYSTMFGTRPDFKITDCEVRESTGNLWQHDVYFGTDTGVDYCNLANKTNIPAHYIEGSSTSVSMLPGTLAQYIENNKTYLYQGSCVKTAIPGAKSRSESTVSIPFTNAQASSGAGSNDLKNTVMKEMSSIYGNRAFMTFIANGTGASTCPLQTGGKIGRQYNEAAASYPSLASVYPICAATYEPALEKIKDFVISSTATKYTTALPTGSRVLKVELVRGSTVTLLEPANYTISGNEIEIRVSILANDKIRMTYAPR